MDATIQLRPITLQDGPALRALAARSPDAGRIPVAAVYHVDPVRLHRALEPDTAGVAAVTAGGPDAGALVGAGFVRFGERRLAGRWLPAAELHSLVVDPAYRRRGIGGRLVDWRLAAARERVGPEGVIFTRVQAGNAASLTLARRWATHELGPVTTHLARPRRRPPRPRPGITVREATVADLPAYAAGLSAFTADCDLAERHTAETLADWLARSPFPTPFRRLIVATDPAGRLLAGLGLTEQHRAVAMQVGPLPAALRLANRLLRWVPADGRLRQVAVSHIWILSGQIDTAHLLWKMVCWKWCWLGDIFTVACDRCKPVAWLLGLSLREPAGQSVSMLLIPRN